MVAITKPTALLISPPPVDEQPAKESKPARHRVHPDTPPQFRAAYLLKGVPRSQRRSR